MSPDRTTDLPLKPVRERREPVRQAPVSTSIARAWRAVVRNGLI